MNKKLWVAESNITAQQEVQQATGRGLVCSAGKAAVSLPGAGCIDSAGWPVGFALRALAWPPGALGCTPNKQ